MPKEVTIERKSMTLVVPHIDRSEFPRTEYGDWEFIPHGDALLSGPYTVRVFSKPEPTGEVKDGVAVYASKLVAETTSPVPAEHAEKFARETLARTRVAQKAKKGH